MVEPVEAYLKDLNDVERAVAEGYRYLALKPWEVYSLTPREFQILMRAYQERQYDEFDRMAFQTMMVRQAYHAKKLKHADLFKRSEQNKPKRDVKELKAEMERQQALLDTLILQPKK
ncbi:phage tail assembly chaperone [Paenisporosarcina sp. NPDC076898]|uniref:phage tail assembly chaperone n=1 Tax=unclassified Paenisporosarcina TaxID=2642018 RepID=UPI003D04EEA2